MPGVRIRMVREQRLLGDFNPLTIPAGTEGVVLNAFFPRRLLAVQFPVDFPCGKLDVWVREADVEIVT